MLIQGLAISSGRKVDWPTMLNGEFDASGCDDGCSFWTRLHNDNGIDDECLILGLSLAGQDVPPGRLRMPNQQEPVKVVHSLSHFSQPYIDLVLVLDPEARKVFDESAEALISEFSSPVPTLIILIPRRPAPTYGYDEEGIFSFICSASVFRDLLAYREGISTDRLCFAMLYAMLNGHVKVDRVLTRQIPYANPTTLRREEATAAVIMPHRGKLEHLERALYFLGRMASENMLIRVGLDEERPCEYAPLLNRYPAIELFYATPSRLGPYVIRQELASRCDEPMLLFQDSDDVSCHDRFTTLYAEMRHSGCDLVGSHELQVDEVSCKVIAARYPLDVCGALREGNDGALLLGTSMIKRQEFIRIGGFSTDQVIASDTQFLLRAYFSLRIRNVDSFLYIRRIHRASLTAAPETKIGVPLRHHLSSQWNADFEAVRNGRMRLEQSSLRPIAGTVQYQFLPFEPRAGISQRLMLVAEQELTQ
jgi:hypothetical protein